MIKSPERLFSTITLHVGRQLARPRKHSRTMRQAHEDTWTTTQKDTAMFSGNTNKQTSFPGVSLAGWLHVSLIRIVYTFVFLPSFNARLSQLHNSWRFFTLSSFRTCWKEAVTHASASHVQTYWQIDTRPRRKLKAIYPLLLAPLDWRIVWNPQGLFFSWNFLGAGGLPWINLFYFPKELYILFWSFI